MWYKRVYWIDLVERGWQRRSVVWLAGVRRSGKTVLCQSLPEVEYFDCELPSVRLRLRDPETFLESLRDRRVILDEVHRLPDPSSVLKIAADHFSGVRLLATGSSTLEASARFRDALVGRREVVWLTPMISSDLADFGSSDLLRRLERGGLPPFFLAEGVQERDYQDWLDAYWAKDLLALFRLEKRDSFLQFTELLLGRSGSVFEASRYARECGVSHTTIRNYLSVLEATYVAHRLRPYSRRAATEIVAAPKVYGFDTGFVVRFRGWRELREEDLGSLWEHYVLNELHGRLQTRRLHYWRDKRGHEVDIVVPVPGQPPVAVECKWRAAAFEPGGLLAFRRQHPGGRNLVVAADVNRPWAQRYGPEVVEFVGLEGLVRALQATLRGGEAQSQPGQQISDEAGA
jgi:predicted AAA+ superfamily ATPase